MLNISFWVAIALGGHLVLSIVADILIEQWKWPARPLWVDTTHISNAETTEDLIVNLKFKHLNLIKQI